MNLDQANLKNFLLKQGITKFNDKKVAGDASFRSYYRINIEGFDESLMSQELSDYFSQNNKSLILMFAPPEHEDIKPFMKIGKILLKNDLSSPLMFGFDIDLGFLLLQDFGDESFNKSMRNLKDGYEESLYQNSIDCLVKIQKIGEVTDSIAKYNHQILFNEILLFVDWYLKFEKNIELDLNQMKKFKDLCFSLFDKLNWQNKVLVLRDYHADNLMVIPGESTIDRVGLLDFQDALTGSSAYDLVSLIEDARRDVDLDLAKRLIDYYFQESSDLDSEKFLIDYKILSLQRNLKILGIFSRLARRDGKKSYLDLIPRVKNHVIRRLEGDELFAEIKVFLEGLL